MTVREVYKGHGTRNDFVLIDDREGRWNIDAAQVRALTDRRDGVGGDGLIRLAPTSAMSAEQQAQAGDAQWFMDYRNADGSIAQMCGNGVRVFTAFAEFLGLTDSAQTPFAVGTRAGKKTVTKDRATGWYSVSMGPGVLVNPVQADQQGSDALVSVRGIAGPPRMGLSISMGNPHTVVALNSRQELADLDLSDIPVVNPSPPDGTNVEFVVPFSEEYVDGKPLGRAAMRVHERGVGETPSCGTGACAVAVALHYWGGENSPQLWLIDVPGGQVKVDVCNLADVVLSGPARLVGKIDLFDNTAGAQS